MASSQFGNPHSSSLAKHVDLVKTKASLLLHLIYKLSPSSRVIVVYYLYFLNLKLT